MVQAGPYSPLLCSVFPYRKQELANSSDVTVPDRSLSPPLTAPPTMKVRGLELVSGGGGGWGLNPKAALCCGSRPCCVCPCGALEAQTPLEAALTVAQQCGRRV